MSCNFILCYAKEERIVQKCKLVVKAIIRKTKQTRIRQNTNPKTGRSHKGGKQTDNVRQLVHGGNQDKEQGVGQALKTQVGGKPIKIMRHGKHRQQNQHHTT